MGDRGIIGKPGLQRSWTLRMDQTEVGDGMSVWDGCPFADGQLVYLNVLILPRMALRIGDYKARNAAANPGPGPSGLPGSPGWVNGPLTKTGLWPGGDVPILTGCNLAIIPAWDRVFEPMAGDGDNPAPAHGENRGVDCTSVDQLEVWAAVAPAAPALEVLRAFPWVRHPTGFWAQPHGMTATASGRGVRFVIPCVDADRVYCEVRYPGTFTAGGGVSYGRITPPPIIIPGTTTKAGDTNVRLSAVVV